MNLKKLASIFIVLIVFAGIFWFAKQDKQTLKLSENKPAELAEDGGQSYNPISLPALMAKQFDGRELKLGQVLDETAAYTRYFITYKSGELTISGILNVPKGEGPFPVLILNHGHIDTSVYT